MPEGKRGKVVGGAASPDDPGGDRINALPDDALHHVLSFLPAEDAVRTCVLARRWRHLWKSAAGLRIGFSQSGTAPSVDSLRHFVNHLLLLRNRDSCLHTCERRLDSNNAGYWLVQEKINLNLWIRHVLDREVRILRLEIRDTCYGPDIDNLPLASQHLKTLALTNVELNSGCSFSACPNLEHLEIVDSYICQVEISSKSLKHLSISDCYFSFDGLHTLNWTPNLVSLRLDGHFSSVPVLGSMPSLKEAFARNHFFKTSACEKEDCFTCPRGFNDDPSDESNYQDKCFLLQGLF